jgi:hypothetical protein
MLNKEKKMDGSRRLDQSKSSKKKARELHKLEKKTSKIDKTQEKSIGATSEPNYLDVLRRSPEEKSERSHLSDLPHEQLEELIEAKKEEKKSFESAYSELLAHITTARKELQKIQEKKNLSIEASVNKQLRFIENHSYLKVLMVEDIEKLKENFSFLKKEERIIGSFRLRNSKIEQHMHVSTENFSSLFQDCGVDGNFTLVIPEPSRLLSIDNYNKFFSLSFRSLYLHDAKNKLLSKNETIFFKQPTMVKILKIARMNKLKKEVDLWDERTKIIQQAREQFNKVNFEDETATREASNKTLRECIAEYSESAALNILKTAYIERLKHKTNPNKKDTLEKFDKAWEKEQQKANIQEDRREYLENCTGYSEDELQGIIQEGLEMSKNYFNAYLKDLNQSYRLDITRSAVSFYDLVEKNITHRLSDSLDELRKKNQEALSLLEEEIKKLEALHPHKQNEQSNKPQVAMEQPAEKQQKNLDTAFKDADMTPECRAIVLSYLSGLFKKSHPQSSNDATTRETFFEKNVNEAKQVATYLEQKHSIYHKIQEDVIQLAVHLKHAFGFPLHQASIDKDFNIVESRPSKEGSSSLSRLDIDRQGRILKDGRVQRVYLIGFQDASEASNSDADAKPMALLAMQSTETGYPKYGAGTPLPTGGVVDVVTAQQSTPDQPNLYKATLAIETLQETHDQKAIDMQTLELFETETVMNPHTKAPLYEITTFTGKVKDKPPQALPEHSKPEEAYQETTGPCIVDLNKLLSTVRNIIEDRGRFCPLWRAMMYIKRQIAQQALGEDKVPTSDQGWQTNGAIRWADFHEYSTSMNMFAKYLVLAYREELGLAGSK